MGEVEQLEDAVDQRIAKGDQRVEASELQPIDQLLRKVLQEVVHGVEKGTGEPVPFLLTPLAGDLLELHHRVALRLVDVDASARDVTLRVEFDRTEDRVERVAAEMGE